jgi:hypothetical protein
MDWTLLGMAGTTVSASAGALAHMARRRLKDSDAQDQWNTRLAHETRMRREHPEWFSDYVPDPEPETRDERPWWEQPPDLPPPNYHGPRGG